MSTNSHPNNATTTTSSSSNNNDNNTTNTNTLYEQLDQSTWVFTPPGAPHRKKFAPHDFAGYGSYHVRHTPRKSEIESVSAELHRLAQEEHGGLLGELQATAISGNDILSSTFYVSGLVTLSAGIMAPLCLVLVAAVLYLFRGIYHETVMALPCNGGTYNILLNCTSKQFASMAAVFAIIAYITTGVVSALEAVAYLDTVVGGGGDSEQETPQWLDQQTATIALLAFFCGLTNLGMKESAAVATAIFVLHVATLTLLTLLGTLHVLFHSEQLLANWSAATPSFPAVDMAGDIVPGTIWTALFYGFSSAMLGVSGFETSSQFVEEQAPGVFPKTLRNMWLGIFIFNPLLSLISFSALTLDEIMEHHDTVLARTAQVVGTWLQTAVTGKIPAPDSLDFGVILSTLVSVDAFVVLSAALLTGYVGINGLIRRMSMDRCLPQFLLMTNPWTGTDSFILVGFFLLCVSQVVILESNVEALGGVYCYAFLTVMTIFAFGNLLLKVKRPSLPRQVTTGWLHSIVGLVAVVMALLGNILGKPELLTYFFVYFLIVGVLVLIMFQRVRILRLVFKLFKIKQKTASRHEEKGNDDEADALVSSTFLVTDKDLEVAVGEKDDVIPPKSQSTWASSERMNCLQRLSRAVREMQDVPFVFFCKHDDLYLLNKAMLYIQKNEQTNKIIVVHCKGGLERSSSSNNNSLAEHVKMMDLMYPKVKISLLIVNTDFSPVTVEWLSRALDVPINAMFISCPDERFTMTVSQLRGMRIIFSYD